ncbi:uncharacterized protein LOC108683334 [Hyalella azteca]|uniref:Uncharacterized protein LOC108683334 n=1 Tax=Hyalella azteca TaxID=294128 RepID=A0A8B7PQ55_HYAAZ|nr:uncharacterized protein LOC108683334 [Hyalella azteca]
MAQVTYNSGARVYPGAHSIPEGDLHPEASANLEHDTNLEAPTNLEALKNELLTESKSYCYPSNKKEIRQRYKNTAYELYKQLKYLEFRPNFLSFGSRRSSTISNYGNTPIVMRRSVSSNGELSGVQAYHFGSLRGVPASMTEQEGKYGTQFGSLRGLPTTKRLSRFDEVEEETALLGQRVTDSHDELKTGELSGLLDNKSERSWDAASVDNGMSSIHGKKAHKSKLFRKHKDQSGIYKDKWRESSEALKGDLSTKSSPLHEVHHDIQKSSESLTSVKRKKLWWFRRKKSKMPYPLEEHAIDLAKGNGAKLPHVEERTSMNEKAVSDNNLKIQPTEDIRSVHEELRKSQILLKGYSQRNVAGLNLSKRLSGANQSVTSRSSLTGSDLMMSDSSKSFMQYDLPRTKEHHRVSPIGKNSVSDMIREGQSYEEQFETSLGGDYRTTTTLLSERNSSSDRYDNTSVLAPIAVGEEWLPNVSNDLNPVEHDFDAEKFNSNAKHTDSALQELESLDRMLGELQEAQANESVVQYHNSESSDVELRHNMEPLSPDSRPIRPLHVSSPIKSTASPPLIRSNVVKAASLLGQEPYPHSLMDRPITSRLAKRLSSEMEAKDAAADKSDSGKKSNIAYTLTFDKELLCVNLRTKSATGGPSDPIAVSADPSAIPEVPIVSDRNLPFDIDNEQVVTFERQHSGGDDRETSPGYRLAYQKGGKRSPTPPRRSLRKNPKVMREKDRLTTPGISVGTEVKNCQELPLAVHQVENLSTPNTNIESEKRESIDNTKVSVTRVLSEDPQDDPVLRIDVRSAYVQEAEKNPENDFPVSVERISQHIEVIEFNSEQKPISDTDLADTEKVQVCLEMLNDLPETVISNAQDSAAQSNEELIDIEEKPIPKLQRRNTFTLSCSSAKAANGEGPTNGVEETNVNHSQQFNGSKESSETLRRTNGDLSAIPLPKSPTVPESPMSSSTSSLKSPSHVAAGSPNLGGATKTRIPVRRGATPESASKPRTTSKIPMMTSGTPERSSLRGKIGNRVGVTNIPSVGIPPRIPPRKPSITDGSSAAAKIGAATSPMTDNFLKTDDNTIVVKRETFIQITPEASSVICALM